MNVVERVAFTWVVAWVLMDSFLPNASHSGKIEAALVVTVSIAYLYGLHTIVFSRIKKLFNFNGNQV